MTQLLGGSRVQATFDNQVEADERLQALLTLYKQPATIKSMHQTFFYVEALSDLVYYDPLTYYYGIDPLFYTGTGAEPANEQDLANYPFINMRNPWYGFIGTKKKFNISSKVNDLLGQKVPSDKYVYEINLAEAVIEADPSNWVNLPDQVIRRGPPLTEANALGDPADTDEYANLNVDITYINADTINPVDEPVKPVRYNLLGSLNQATKLSSPQTLYCRIPELSNGEPYNWAVTNSGNYSIDKGHQLLVRHGDIVCSDLTLEYGHMVFVGDDEDTTVLATTDPIVSDRTRPKYTEKQKYQRYVYIDYNYEMFDVKGRNWPHLNYRSQKITLDPKKVGGLVTMIDDPIQYPDFYFGNIGLERFVFKVNPEPAPFDPADRELVGLKSAAEIEEFWFKSNNRVGLDTPINRPPFVTQFFPCKSDAVTEAGIQPTPYEPYLLQGKPLLFNQQVSKIGFRFMVRVINLF